MLWSPARNSLSSEHSSQSAAPWTKTAPFAVLAQSISAKRSGFLAARFRATTPCSSARTLSPREGRGRSSGHVVDECATHTETNGGSRDTDVNELAASPAGKPFWIAATAVTPLGKLLNAARSASGA